MDSYRYKAHFRIARGELACDFPAMARVVKKASVKLARQAFLYGNGDGVPVTNPEKLAVIGECHIETIRTHLPTWVAEREEMLAGTSEAGLSLHLSRETLKRHKQDLEFIRAKLDETQREIDQLPDILEKLEGWFDSFTEKDADKAIRMFDSYIRTSLNKKSLIATFQSLQRQWTQYAGIDSLTVVAEAREKAMSVGRAKIALRAEEGAATGGAGLPEPAARGRFERAIEAPAVDDDEEGL